MQEHWDADDKGFTSKEHKYYRVFTSFALQKLFAKQRLHIAKPTSAWRGLQNISSVQQEKTKQG